VLTPEHQIVLSKLCLGCLDKDGKIINLDKTFTKNVFLNEWKDRQSPLVGQMWQNLENNWSPSGKTKGKYDFKDFCDKDGCVEPRIYRWEKNTKTWVNLYEIHHEDYIWLIGCVTDNFESVLDSVAHNIPNNEREKDEKGKITPVLYIHDETGKIIWYSTQARGLLGVSSQTMPTNIRDTINDTLTEKRVSLLLRAEFPISSYFVETINKQKVLVSVRSIPIENKEVDGKSYLRHAVVGLAQPLSNEKNKKRQSIYDQLDSSNAALYRYLHYTPQNWKRNQSFSERFITPKPNTKKIPDFALSYANKNFFFLAGKEKELKDFEEKYGDDALKKMREKYYFDHSLIWFFEEEEWPHLYKKALGRVYSDTIVDDSAPPENYYRTLINDRIVEIFEFATQFAGHTLYCEGVLRDITEEITEATSADLASKMLENIEQVLPNRDMDTTYFNTLEFLNSLFNADLTILLKPTAPRLNRKNADGSKTNWFIRHFFCKNPPIIHDRTISDSLNKLLTKNLQETGICNLRELNISKINSAFSEILPNSQCNILAVWIRPSRINIDKQTGLMGAIPQARPSVALIINPKIAFPTDLLKGRETDQVKERLQRLYKNILMEKNADGKYLVEQYINQFIEVLDLSLLHYQRDKTILLSQQLESSESWEKKAHRILEEICYSLRCDGGALFLRAENKLELKASFNLIWEDPNYREVYISEEGKPSLVREIALDKKIISSQDPLNEIDYGNLARKVHNIRRFDKIKLVENDDSGYPIESFLGVPIRTASKPHQIVGVIVLLNKRDPNPGNLNTDIELFSSIFSWRDMYLLQSLAEHLVPFLSLAQTHDEMARNLEVLGHELPSPLSVISNLSDWVKVNFHDPTNRIQVLDRQEIIYNACQHMKALVGNVSIIKMEEYLRRIAANHDSRTKPERLFEKYGLLQPSNNPISLYNATKEVTNWLEFYAYEKDTILEATVSRPFSGVIGQKFPGLFISRSYFQQTVFNIINNAIRYRGDAFCVPYHGPIKLDVIDDISFTKRIQVKHGRLFFHGIITEKDLHRLLNYDLPDTMKDAFISLYHKMNNPGSSRPAEIVQIDISFFYHNYDVTNKIKWPHYRIVFNDWGKGIEPDCKNKVFQIGYRSPRANRTDLGTGFGLWLVQKVVNFYGGVVKVTHEIYPTQITIWLPMFLTNYDLVVEMLKKKVTYSMGGTHDRNR